MPSYFLERKAELVGPSLRKPFRDSRAVQQAYRERVARERLEREAAAASRRLMRTLNSSFEKP